MSTELVHIQRAVAEFDRVEAGLAALRAKHGGVLFDVATTTGMEAAKEARREIREPRLEVEKIRKEAKAPLLKLGRDLDATAARITKELEKIEDPIHQQIKAHEDRKEAERQARIAAEAARVKAIQERIAELHGCMTLTASSGAARIADHISDLEAIAVDATFEEFQDHAAGVKEAAMKRLGALWSAAREHEAAQKKLEEERAELARQRAEQAARDEAERERLAQEAAANKARRDAEEAEHARRREAERKADADRRAELDREETAAADRRRQEEERVARNENALAEIQAMHHQLVIAEIGRRPYCKGGDVASVDWLLAETEKWPVTEEHFGVLFTAAKGAKEGVLAGLRAKREEFAAHEAREEARKAQESTLVLVRDETVSAPEKIAAVLSIPVALAPINPPLVITEHQARQIVAAFGGEEGEIALGEFTESADPDTGEILPAGLYAWFPDCPEEGRIFLEPKWVQ
jgi:hypothetical protein